MDHHPIDRQHEAGPRRHKPLRFAALGIALVSAPAPAGATELAGAELRVTRSPTAYDCPDATALAQAAVALGTAPAMPGSPLRLEVQFDRRPDGYAALIVVSGRKHGTRELNNASTTCGPLADAVSVVLAVLTDLIPPPNAAPTLIPAPPAAPAPAPAFTFAAGPDFGVAYGLVGEAVTATLGAALRARYRAAELELGGFWSTPHFESVAPGVVSLGLRAGTALGCGWLGAEGRATLGACAGAGVGSLSGSGHGYDRDGDASTLWTAALGGIAAELRLRPHWACRFALTAVVPFRSYAVVVNFGGQGVASAPAAIFLRFGPEYRFW